LYDSTVRIPLIVRPPVTVASAEARDDPAQLTDLFTTILAAAAIPATDPRIEAIDLLSRRAPEDRAVLAEYYLPEQAMEKFPKTKRADQVLAPFRRRMRSLQVGNDKLIWGSDGKHELYDVKEDPGERTNLVAPGSQPTEVLMDRLEALIGRLRSEPIPSPERKPMDEKTEEALRSLGYVQ
jgi:arylsulfatase A-like enzyme